MAQLCQHHWKAWLSAATSIGAWMVQFYQHLCKIWLLVLTSTKAWTVASIFAEIDIWPGFQSELGSCGFTSIFANIDVWQKLQPKLGWRNFASIIEKLDFQRLLQSELGWCSFTSIFAKFDFWCWLQPKLERLPASLQKLTFGQDFNQSLDRVVLPASLQTLPESLQELTFETTPTNHGVNLPGHFQSLNLAGGSSAHGSAGFDKSQEMDDQKVIQIRENMVSWLRIPGNVYIYNYGQSPCSMGKSTINGHFQ